MKDLLKTRGHLIVAAVLVAFLCAMPAVAGQGAASFTGKVKDVDLQEKSFVAGSPDGDVVIYIEQTSKITTDGQAGSLADVRVGMVVKVDYTLAGEDKIARSVELLP